MGPSEISSEGICVVGSVGLECAFRPTVREGVVKAWVA